MGPIRNRNFPYVVMGRFLYLADALRQRTHARRETLEIQEGDLASRINQLPQPRQAALHRALDRLRRQKPGDDLAPLLLALIRDKSA